MGAEPLDGLAVFALTLHDAKLRVGPLVLVQAPEGPQPRPAGPTAQLLRAVQLSGLEPRPLKRSGLVRGRRALARGLDLGDAVPSSGSPPDSTAMPASSIVRSVRSSRSLAGRGPLRAPV